MAYHDNQNGAWIVTYLRVDGQRVDSVHSREIEAHRAANGTGRYVKFWPDNTDISQAYVVQNEED